MTKKPHVALLRGVNVGGNKRVPMADWKAWLAELGCAAPATLLNSGNAAFLSAARQPEKLAAEIAAQLFDKLGFEVPVVVKSDAELARVVADLPWDVTAEGLDPSRLLVAFVPTPDALAALRDRTAALVAPPERFHVGREAAYLYCGSGILESRAGAALVGKGPSLVTTRNWATVLKLDHLARQLKEAQ
ncbi:MAG: DUF1697 domain-containing protein [Pelomonas sp.]|nr:DUF1697 domain-containing protein [Roseateles sp.]